MAQEVRDIGYMDKVSVSGRQYGPKGLFLKDDPDLPEYALVLFQQGENRFIISSIHYNRITGIEPARVKL